MEAPDVTSVPYTVSLGITLPCGSVTVIVSVPEVRAPPELVETSRRYVTPVTPAAVEVTLTVGAIGDDANAAAGAHASALEAASTATTRRNLRP
jgi:hypothetical protein